MVLKAPLAIREQNRRVWKKKKGKNPPRGLFHYFQQIKQPKEKGQVKTVVFLKTRALPRIHFLARLTSSPHSCDSSPINRSCVHQPGEPEHRADRM